jgi:hypothetical protein
MNLTKAPFFMLPLVNIFNHPLPPIWPQRRKHLNAIINMRTHTDRQYYYWLCNGGGGEYLSKTMPRNYIRHQRRRHDHDFIHLRPPLYGYGPFRSDIQQTQATHSV